MPPPPSSTYQRLREYIAERMRMSHIYQPLMLLELLGRSSPAPAQDVARRILGSRWWARFTFNGITTYGNGAYSLIGGDELQQLCRQRLDAFREQRALAVDHIVPKNQGGSDAISNLQARWRAAAGCCWRTGWRSRGDTWWARWPQLSR